MTSMLVWPGIDGRAVVALVIGSVVAVFFIALAMRFRWRREAMRREQARCMPVGADGIIAGAGAIALRGSGSRAALLVHGFGSTPQTMAGLAAHLHRVEGWTVSAPLLPGHGRSLAAFDAVRAVDWQRAVHAECEALCRTHETVVLIGHSMGGALVTIEGARSPAVRALVLLAPYLTPMAAPERLAPIASVVAWFVPYLAGGDVTKSILDPEARRASVGYIATPTRRIADLVSTAHDARIAAQEITAPTLMIHSRMDYRIPVHLAETHPALFVQARPLVQEWIDGSGHTLTVDYGREHVWARTAEWLRVHAGPASVGPQVVH
jgi:carboxylesterase